MNGNSLLSYMGISDNEVRKIEKFINDCIVIDITSGIKKITINIRKRYGLKLPDAIIAGSAIYMQIPVVTADSDFKKVKDADVIFYEK